MSSSPNHDDLAHLKIPLEDILSTTNNFDEKNVIETVDFGKIYKGQLLRSGELININARKINKERKQAEHEFWMEISMLASLKHKNLVSLVGFCDENDEKVIINVNETRGWLDEYLSNSVSLTWVRRLEICVGLARALRYIHHDEPRDFSIIHRNIRSSTVQLNDDWEPKLSNFERSMKIEASQRHHSFNNGACSYTPGYVDSTFFKAYTVNHKLDIYSIGIVLCEVLCGRRSIISSDTNKYLAPLAVSHYREKRLDEIIDWDLWKQMDSQSFNIFAKIAYDCLNEERSKRPDIDEILTRLEKALELQLEHQNAPFDSSLLPLLDLTLFAQFLHPSFTYMHVIIFKLNDDLTHLKIPLENILSATNNFADENVIETANFGNIYKGQLLWCGRELINISARRIKTERKQAEQEFWMEISMLASLKHKNLVSLVGFCDENDEKVIINMNETRGWLDTYLNIYTFGIVLFEVLCGRRSIISGDINKYLAPLAVSHYREKRLDEIIDWDLWKQMDSQSFNIFAEIAYDCLNEERSKRPDIDEILTRLEKALELQLEHQNAIMSSPNDFAHLKIPIGDILSATNNFADENVIETADFGNIYKGQLLWCGELINISARRIKTQRKQAEQEFWMEISMLASLKHKNLVSLVGFCDENDKKVIINMKETRGWLDSYLSDPMSLTWVRRLEICVGVAHALSYIHHDEPRDFSVIHRDIRSFTVQLNDDWEPKLSNFERSMKIEASQRHNSFHTHKVEYVDGYGDPTYIETKSVNHKSDMYSFGILLFELLCCRKSVIANDSN
nr:protein kinase-like domain, phloem protein 2-like protein [Tanacetum cinerariifolium]